jgi:ribosomal protein S27AE
MEELLYTKVLIFTAGVAVIGFIEWYVFRNKKIAFRIKYHPIMMLIGALMFGVLGAVVIYDNNSPVYISVFFLIGSLAVGIVDILKRQICSNCGYESNGFAINGLFTRYKYCPKCGSSYMLGSSKKGY